MPVLGARSGLVPFAPAMLAPAKRPRRSPDQLIADLKARTPARKLRMGLLGLLAVILTFLGACKSAQINQRLDEYRRIFDPMLNTANKEECLQRFGPPARTFSTGGTEVWEYHQSFGAASTGYAYAPQQSAWAYGRGSSYEVYDYVRLTFDQTGVLRQWNAYVQR